MLYCWRGGERRRGRTGLVTMHILRHDPLGEPTGEALCGEEGFDRSCNLPLGNPLCQECTAKAVEIREADGVTN